MKTISFYSYKGGVGRSLALAYTAKYLAYNNIGVCILDIDLEAPGIINKFPENLESVHSKLGVVDYVNSFRKSKIPENIEDYFTTVYQKKENKYGYIKIMGAGKGIYTNEYWNNLSKIDWNKLFSDKKCTGLEIFEILKRQIEQQINPEYLLIDSRSGVTKIGMLCTSVLPDKVVMLLANNDENFYGSKMMYHHIKNSTDYKIDNIESDIICAITRFPTDDDKSIEDKKLALFDMDAAKTKTESEIIDKFHKIVEHDQLDKNHISAIHSNREVEREELSILKKGYFARRDVLENDYSKLIKKMVDNELLAKRATFNASETKFRFTQFDLLEIIKNELKELQSDTSTDMSNPYRSLYEHALCERSKKNIPDALISLFSLIDDANVDIKWKTHAHYLRGRIFLYDLYHYEKSITDLENVYNINNSFNSYICYDLALCYFCVDKLEQAFDHIERYISDNKYDHRAFLLRAEINILKKEQKKIIIQDYDKAIFLKEDFVDSYYRRGLYYHYDLDPCEIENALKDYDKAMEIDSRHELKKQNKFLYVHRGNLYLKKGEPQNALIDYDKAIEIDLNYERAYKKKGDLYVSLGKITEALEEYKNAYRIAPGYKEAYESIEKLKKPVTYYKELEDTLHYDLQYALYYDINKDTVKYVFPINYHNEEPFEFALIKKNDRILLSDQGRTLKMLDKVYDLKEYDVTKNLTRILKEFRVFKNGFDFSFEIGNITIEDEEKKELEKAKFKLLCCVSFMDKMRLFYGDASFSDNYKFSIFTGSKSERIPPIGELRSFPIKYYKTDIEYKFAFVKKYGKYYITDQGNTYNMLDEVFQLSEMDVQKMLNAIMNECQVLQIEDEFLIEVNTWDENSNVEGNTDIDKVKHKLLECVSFMDTMRIFFV